MKGLVCRKGSGSSATGGKEEAYLRSSQSSRMMLLSGKNKARASACELCLTGNIRGIKDQF